MNKQMSMFVEEAKLSSVPIRLVKCLAVHNEEGWVEANLANNYSEFDVIRVVEGAVQGRPGSTEDGHSTDATLERIRNFPDPDGKIELITIDRYFKSLEEQKQLFIEFAQEGDWLFIVDCDEFYMEGDVAKIRQHILRHPAASEFIPLFLHFYRDFHHIKAPHPEWQVQHQRIIRYRPGLKYHTHPVATDAQGKCTYFSPEYQSLRYTIPIYIYHYGHAKGKEFHRMKQEFYKSELEKFKLEDGTDASVKFDEKFLEFVNETEDDRTILYFDGPHPEAAKKLPPWGYMAPTYSKRHKFLLSSFEGKTEEEIAEILQDTRMYLDGPFENWKSNFVYAAEKLPNIALWMMGEWKRAEPFYNVSRV